MSVQPWVKALTESVLGGAPFAVGDVVKHPDGRQVRIVGGRYWGDRGLSNHWTWQPLDVEGRDVGDRESGYGWQP
jgi:hypothetical protein